MSTRLGLLRKDPDFLAALDRLRDWTRDRFRLPVEAPVLVSELACTLPGCAPLETLVAFWTESGDRHHFKIHKPTKEVVLEDLPVVWIDDAQFTKGIVGCPCC